MFRVGTVFFLHISDPWLKSVTVESAEKEASVCHGRPGTSALKMTQV